MSRDALKAFAALRPQLGQMHAALNLSDDRSINTEAVAEVGRQLAYRYDPQRRGYVDDRIDQLAAATGITERKVKRSLQVLNMLGVWTAERRGGSRDAYGSRRIPGPELCAAAHRLGLNLSTPQAVLDLGPELGPLAVPDTQELGPVPVPDTHGTRTVGGGTRTVGGGTRTGTGPLPIGTYKTSSSSPSDLTAVAPAIDDDEFDRVLTIVAEHRRSVSPVKPVFADRWLATVRQSVARSDGHQIRQALERGLSTDEIAGKINRGETLASVARPSVHPPDCPLCENGLINRNPSEPMGDWYRCTGVPIAVAT
jgi:hypothetical protein